MMEPILLNITLFLGLFIFTLIKKKNNLSIVVVGLYTFSVLLSFVWYDICPKYLYRYNNLNYIGYIYYFILFVISVFPLLKYKQNKYKCLSNLSPRFNRWFPIIVILIVIPTFIIDLPEALDNYILMSVDDDAVKEIYNDTLKSTSEKRGWGNNFHVIIAGLLATVSVFYFFYYLTLEKKKILIIIGLFIVILFPFQQSFKIASRTAMTWWIMDLFIGLIIFIPYYSKKLKKAILIPLGAVFILMAFIFTVITIGRFNSSVGGEMTSIIRYVGESTINFDNYIFYNDVTQKGDNSFSTIKTIIGLSDSDSISQRQSHWRSKLRGIPQGVFYSYIGDLYLDFGPVITFVLLSIFSVIANNKINIPGRISSPQQLFLLFFWTNLIFSSLFYFRYKTIGGNLNFIFILIFYFVLKCNNSKRLTFKK